MAKLISAKTIYTGNSPTLTRVAAAFHSSVQACFEHEKELQLRVEQYRLLWRDDVVYESEDRGGSIAFMLFKDGVGELTFYPSVTTAELDQFVDILKEEIHSPSPNSDVVTRLWNADFGNITYRVLDEDPTGRPHGDRGAGAHARGSILQAEDHPGVPGGGTSMAADRDAASIADYMLGVVTASRPECSEVEKELFVQDMLAMLFSASADEQRAFLEEHADDARVDKVAALLETALEFTRDDDPAMLENALFLVERAAGFAITEADARTLTSALTLIRSAATSHPRDDIRAGLQRLERDFVDGEFLRGLGNDENLPTEDVLGVMRFLRTVGSSAIPVIVELLHIHRRTVIHREGCEALLAIAGQRIDDVIDSLNVDNVHVARDAVHLLLATERPALPPLVRELVHYPDLNVREATLQLLARTADEESVRLLCILLDDEEKGIRLRAISELERIGGLAAASKLMSLCLDDDRVRDTDEEARLFEAAGRIATDDMVDYLEPKLKKRSWLRLRNHAGSDHKKLAVAALRYARGERAHVLLERLADDRDDDVRAAANRILDERKRPRADGGGDPS